MTKWEYVILSGLFVLLLLLFFVRLWLYPLWQANVRDSDKAHAAADRAAAILQNPAAHSNLKSNDEIDVSFKRFRGDWAMQFHAFTTFSLLVVLCVWAYY
jgi:hypothetical protein